MLGLFAFSYLLLHFLTWLVLDRGLDWSGIVDGIAKRPFVTVGFTALVLLVPLAVTSTDPAGCDGWDVAGTRCTGWSMYRRPARRAAFPVAGQGGLARTGHVHRHLPGVDGLALAQAARRADGIVARPPSV